MKLDITGGSYRDKYVAVNSERTINFYPVRKVLTNDRTKYDWALYPTPGLSQFSNTTKTNLRGIFTARTLTEERCFVVADNFLYEIDSAGVATSRGQMTNITNNTTPVYMEVNGNNELMICHSSASYYLALGTNTLTQITDVDFPSTPTSLSYMNGYFIVTAGGRVYFSDLNSAANWTGASVFTPTSRADNTIHAVCWRDDIHCFSSETTETYLNDGVNPFSKQPRSTINIGLMSTASLAVLHNGMLFLGKTRFGEANIYFYDGQNCEAIAPFPITWNINNTTPPLANATGFVQYTKDGHIFYYLNIPALNTTWVLDVTLKEWHERQSLSGSSQVGFRGVYFTNFKGLNLFCDALSGYVLKEDYTLSTEAGSAITRTRITNLISNDLKNISIYSLEVDANVGTGTIASPSTAPNLTVSWSRDGGYTYQTATSLSLGASGSYTVRPRVHKLGTGRNWVFKFVLTDAADVMIQSAFINGVMGEY